MLPSPQASGLLPPFKQSAIAHKRTNPQRTPHQYTPAPQHNPTHAPIVVGTYIQEEQETDRSSGKFPYWMRPQVVSDRADRQSQGITPQDYGKRWRATFRHITGDAPVCMPGDRDTAREFWQRVRAAMAKGGWSPSEFGSLYRLEKIWRFRANGLDPRFEVLGTRPGRAVWEDRERIAQIKMTLTTGRIAKGMSA